MKKRKLKQIWIWPELEAEFKIKKMRLSIPMIRAMASIPNEAVLIRCSNVYWQSDKVLFPPVLIQNRTIEALCRRDIITYIEFVSSENGKSIPVKCVIKKQL